MCHYFSQAKLPEDALDFTQMTTISKERKHRSARFTLRHYQIKWFHQSRESHRSPHIAPWYGFVPPLTSKNKHLRHLDHQVLQHCPRPTLFLNPNWLQQMCSHIFWDIVVYRACLREINDCNVGLKFPRACLCQSSRESWGNAGVGAGGVCVWGGCLLPRCNISSNVPLLTHVPVWS